MAIDSTNPSRVMARAVGSMSPSWSNPVVGRPTDGSRPGIAPTTLTLWPSRPRRLTAAVASPTTISAPGQPGRHRFNATSNTMPPTPTARVGSRISSTRPTASHTISCTRSVCSSLMPSRCFSWLAPMRMAAADVKPLRTGRDRKLTRNPSRPSPRTMANAMPSAESSTVVTAPRRSNGRYLGHSRTVEIAFRRTTTSGQGRQHS